MDFSSNVSNEDFTMNNVIRSRTQYDSSYKQKNHPYFPNNNISQSSINGCSLPQFLTDINDPYQPYLIPSIPNQNHNPSDWNFVDTQIQPIYKSSILETLSPKYPFMNVDSYLKENIYCESSDNKIHILNSNVISKNPIDTFNISNDFPKNTRRHDIIDGFKTALDQFTVVASQPFILPTLGSIDNTIEEMMNQRADYEIIKSDQAKDNKMIKRNKRSKEVNIIKGKWTKSEDEELVQQVNYYGTKKWVEIAKVFKGRTGKQCRERWLNHLHPDIKKGDWTEEENRILIEAHKTFGNKWSEISKKLHGRSENAIKNHWNATKRRIKLEKTKENHENVKPQHQDLENYIEHVAINNATNTTGETSNGQENYAEMIDDWDRNWIKDFGIQTDEPPVDPATTSANVPMATTFAEEEN